MAGNNYFSNGSPSLNGHLGGFDDDRVRSDDQLDQVRDLLFGELRHRWDARLSALETRLETLESKFDALSHQLTDERRQEMASLAEGVDELGRHIRRLTRL